MSGAAFLRQPDAGAGHRLRRGRRDLLVAGYASRCRTPDLVGSPRLLIVDVAGRVASEHAAPGSRLLVDVLPAACR